VPRPHDHLFHRLAAQEDHSQHIHLLKRFLLLIPHVVPSDHSLTYPALVHPDLHGDNILVEPDGPPTITGIIDWQSTEIKPLFLQAVSICSTSIASVAVYFFIQKVPTILQHPPGGYIRELPQLPDNLDQLPLEEQTTAEDDYISQMVHVGYQFGLESASPLHYAAL